MMTRFQTWISIPTCAATTRRPRPRPTSPTAAAASTSCSPRLRTWSRSCRRCAHFPPPPSTRRLVRGSVLMARGEGQWDRWRERPCIFGSIPMTREHLPHVTWRAGKRVVNEALVFIVTGGVEQVFFQISDDAFIGFIGFTGYIGCIDFIGFIGFIPYLRVCCSKNRGGCWRNCFLKFANHFSPRDGCLILLFLLFLFGVHKSRTLC